RASGRRVRAGGWGVRAGGRGVRGGAGPRRAPRRAERARNRAARGPKRGARSTGAGSIPGSEPALPIEATPMLESRTAVSLPNPRARVRRPRLPVATLLLEAGELLEVCREPGVAEARRGRAKASTRGVEPARRVRGDRPRDHFIDARGGAR